MNDLALDVRLALAAGQLLASQLYETSARDLGSLAGAPLVLLAVGAVAGLLPARRAARTDPASVLRQG